MSKITSIVPAGTWEYNGETMYSFQMTLDSGESGKVNTKTADRWKVGDEVSATTYNDKQGNPCLKLSKPDTGGFKGGGRKMDASTEKRITFLSCLSSASSFHAQSSVTPEQVIETAKKFANAAYSLSLPPKHTPSTPQPNTGVPTQPTSSAPQQPPMSAYTESDDDLPF